MRLIRSFPADIPPGRSYVIDDAQRFVNADYDYRGLAAVGDDLIHLDWDTAVSRGDLTTFAALAHKAPDSVLVAPVRMEPGSRAGLAEPVWNCRRYLPGEIGMRYVTSADQACDLFGFGMLYLPHALLAEFEQAWAGHFGDIEFAGWHHRTYGEAALTWDIHPVHLHYRISEVIS